MPKLSPISYRYHFGETQYGSYYDDSFEGKMKIKGHEWALNGYLFGIPGSITYSKTEYDSGEISQSSNMIRIGGPSVNIKFEDNFIDIAGVPGMETTRGDDYRSSALEVNIGKFNFGYKIMDGEDTHTRHDGPWGDKMYKDETNVYRVGIAYVGWGPLKLGINSEKYVRAPIQNGWHKMINNKNGNNNLKYWDVVDKKDRFFWYWGSTGGASLWY